MTSKHVFAGFGVNTITPTQSLPLAGIGGRRIGRKTLDDLKVRAIAVTHADTTLVLVSVDVLYVSRTYCDQISAWMEKTYGLPRDNLLVAATHTHCAPLLLDRYFDDVQSDKEFSEHTTAMTKSSIRSAIESQRAATIETSSGIADVSIHRRARRLDRVAMRRFRLRRIMANRPNRHGPVDNTVRSIRFRMESMDLPDIVLVSAGCHPSIIRQDVYSADYPGLIEHHLNDESDRPAQVIFVQGFSGDTRPRLLEVAPIYGWPPGRIFDWLFDRNRFRKNSLPRDADWVAATIAKTMSEASKNQVKTPHLSALRIEVPLPLEKELDLQQLQRMAESESEPEWRRRYAQYALNAYTNGTVVPIRVHRWSLGPGICIIGMEGEIFSQFSEWMDGECNSQEITAIPVGCVGGMVGYIPTASELPGGGYEVDRSRELFGLPSRFAHSAEALLKESVRKVILEAPL
jgi:neutral ceramidase